MICWRIDIRRNFSRYLDGELDERRVAGVEHHLLDCLQCRARLAHIRDGQRLARQMPRLRPERDVWAAIEAGIEASETPRKSRSVERAGWATVLRNSSSAQRLAAALGIIALVFAGLFVLSDRRESDDKLKAWSAIAENFDHKEFHEVTIADISSNTRPHVVAEGYVSEVRIDHDGDLTFRLVEDLQQGEPFIVCEIIEPIRLDPPSVGSRVRVYGVSRYDDQEHHRWHEVHPVLNIETVPR
jgi:hypothetical protein